MGRGTLVQDYKQVKLWLKDTLIMMIAIRLRFDNHAPSYTLYNVYKYSSARHVLMTTLIIRNNQDREVNNLRKENTSLQEEVDLLKKRLTGEKYEL